MRLKIATINVWGLPWPFSVRKRERLLAVANLIRREQFDIIAGQEFWFRRDIRELRRMFPGYHLCESASHWFNRSGLIFLARIPLSCGAFVPFRGPLISWEFPSRKGILRAEIAFGGRSIKVINTHMLYTAQATRTGQQQHQLDQLIGMLDRRPTIVFGDFNREYQDIRLPKNFFLISESTQSSISMTNQYAIMRLNKIGMSDRLPDYIFANFSVRVERAYCITNPVISDHYPVVSEIDM